MVREVPVGTSYGLSARQVFRLKVHAVGRQNKLRLRLGCRGTVPKRPESLRDAPLVASRDVDIAGLENAAEVGLVGSPSAQPLDRRLLVAKGF
nr:hypothetical protein [Edaphobacter modestus]